MAPCHDGNCRKEANHVGLHRARTIDITPDGREVTVVEWSDSEAWDSFDDESTTVTDARAFQDDFDNIVTAPVSQPLVELEAGTRLDQIASHR